MSKINKKFREIGSVMDMKKNKKIFHAVRASILLTVGLIADNRILSLRKRYKQNLGMKICKVDTNHVKNKRFHKYIFFKDEFLLDINAPVSSRNIPQYSKTPIVTDNVNGFLVQI